MSEESAGTVVTKQRKLWIESTPYTPESIEKNIAAAEQSPARVQLIHFAKKPVVDFGCVRKGNSIVRKLLVENPNPYDVEVKVEKFPWKKDFSVDQKHFVVEEADILPLEISWTPSQSGNYRELMMIKYDSSFRVHILLVGHVETPKKKRTGRALKRYAGNKKMMARRSIQSNLSATSNDSTENIDPLSSDKDNKSGTNDRKVMPFSKIKPEDNSRSILSPKQTSSENVFKSNPSLEHVVDGNSRDSYGSITAPSSPSGLEVPVIEVCDHQSQVCNKLEKEEDDVFLGNYSVLNEKNNSSISDSHRATFCVDFSRTLQETSQSFTCQDVTNHPTFILSQESKTDILAAVQCPGLDEKPKSNAQTKSKILSLSKSEKSSALTPRKHRRSRTYNKENDVPIKPKEVDDRTKKAEKKKCEEKMGTGILDYALSVIAQPLSAVRSISEESCIPNPDEQDSLEISKTCDDVSDCSKIIPDILVCESSSTLQSCKTIEDRLSSTQAHDKTLHCDGLPVPDISVINFHSPKKTSGKRKSDDEESPLSKATISRPKRIAFDSPQSRKISPAATRRSSRGSASHGTPKGRALQRRRVARASESIPMLLKTNSAKKKTRKKCSPSSSKRKSTRASPADKSSSLVGAKRMMKLQEKSKILKRRKVQVPQTRLILRTSQQLQKKPVVRISLPFSSRNIFYDDKWREKQERAYTCWLNYVLTPDEFKPNLGGNETLPSGNKTLRNKTLHHSAVFTQNVEKSSLNLRALTKEDASMRAYQIQRRLNRLRRAACELFDSESMMLVIHKIEEEVACGHIKVRNDKQLWADLGNQTNILGLLLSFNTMWLRIGLEATFGEALPLQRDNDEVTVITQFIKRRLLNCDEIRNEFAHPTVPNLFRDGYEDKMANHTLKKFLILILFLDGAKKKRLIDHDPCLFRKESNVKNCNNILVSFSRDLLRGEGDIIKHLSFIGYKVSHVQTYIDEFEYGIGNICVDLRDGIRLVRVCELLFNDLNLTSKLRVPAGSILQKKHNVSIALKSLVDHNVNICDASGKKVEPDHIVKGHREMTLSLLWNIAAHFQLVTAINVELLKGEIEFLKKNLRLKHMLENTLHLYEEENTLPKEKTSATDVVSSLLLEWCRLVCAFKSIAVHNFAASFTDGRVLAHLVSYYQSDLIHPSQICDTITSSLQEPDTALDDSSCVDSIQEVENTKIPTKQLLKNEKTNLKLVQHAAYELGGIPNLLRIDDISNTIPDDKVVRLLVSYLCTRLLDIRIEDRAARTIQIAWRAFISQREIREERRAEEKRIAHQNQAAATIQAFYKGFSQRRRFISLKRTTKMLQKNWRAKTIALPSRNRFLALRASTILIQSVFRGNRSRKIAKKLKLERERLNVAVAKLQAIYKGRQQRTKFILQKESIIKLQVWFSASRLCRLQRRDYIEYKAAVIKVQRKWRATLQARKQAAIYSTKRESAIVIQRVFRKHKSQTMRKQQIAERLLAVQTIQQRWRATMMMQQEKFIYLQKRHSAVAIQCWFRHQLTNKAVQERKICAVLRLQAWWRASVLAKQERIKFLAKRASAIIIQCFTRRYLAIKLVERKRRMLKSTITIQRRWRGTISMKKERCIYLKMKSAAIIMQCAVRCYLGLKIVARKRAELNAIIVLQTRWRATKLARHQREIFLTTRKAALVTQCFIRRYLSRKRVQNMRKRVAACMTIQTHWRSTLLMKEERLVYVKKRSSVVVIQCFIRRCLAMKLAERKRQELKAALFIQRKWRATVAMKDQMSVYQRILSATLAIQCAIRCCFARKRIRKKLQDLHAVIIIQRRWRATTLKNKQMAIFKQQRSAATVIQCAVRQYQAVMLLSQKRKLLNAVLTVQRRWRATSQMRKQRSTYLACRSSVIIAQSIVRLYIARKFVDRQRAEIKAAIVIQRRFWANLKMRYQRAKYLQKRAAAVTIQCALRCYFAAKLLEAKQKHRRAAQILQRRWRGMRQMRRDKCNFQLMRSSAIIIQSAFRRYLAVKLTEMKRKHLRAVLIIQRKFRSTLEMRKQQDLFRKMQSSALIIQCAIRSYFAIKLLDQLKKQRDASIKIQNWWRDTLKTKKQRKFFLQFQSATVIIQCALRRFFAQNLLSKKMRERNAAAVTIQRWWRATLLMKYERKNYLKMLSSAQVIQFTIRRYQAMKLLAAKRKELNATIVIQCKWRATLKMRKVKQEFVNMRSSAVVIQCAIRRHRAINIARQKRIKLKAVITIQRKWRATVIMKRDRDMYLKTKREIIRVQSAVRCFLARKIVLKKRQERAAVVILQRKWRAIMLRNKERKLFCYKRSSAAIIQRAFRYYLVRKLAKEERNLLNASVYIQRRWRSIILMRKERNIYRSKLSSVVLIQSSIRCFLAARLAKRMRQEVLSAMFIQQWWRANRQMKKQRNLFLQKRAAAFVVQCTFRRHIAFKILRSKRRQLQAILMLQRRWRETLAVRKQRSIYLNMRSSAIIIQCSVRCFFSTNLVSEKRRELKAVVCIQRKWRATLLMRQDRCLFFQKCTAAIILQKIFRGFLARQLLKKKRKFFKSVLLIQARLRATLLMRCDISKYLRMREAAISIQCCVRRYQAIKYKQVYQDAVTKIQRSWKATLLMRRERENFLKMKSAALIIQHAVRIFSARKQDARKRREMRAATTIQRQWKAYVMMKYQRCAIIIQCAFRRYIALKVTAKKRQVLRSVLIIQARWRAMLSMKKDRNSYLAMHSAALVIQRAVRYFLHRRLRAEQIRQLRIIVLLQRRWRATMKMKQGRSIFTLKRGATITIQINFRRYFAAKLAAKKLNEKMFLSATTIQRVYRGYMVRKRLALHEDITSARKRCQNANFHSLQNPQHRIGCRMKMALEVLLDIRLYSQIYGSLETLYNLSQLLPPCCERISDAGGTEVLCQLIDSSNRSFAAAVVHKLSLKILLNLVRNSSTREETIEILQRNDKKNCRAPIELLVNELSRFRDKSGRDHTHAPIFCAACELLEEFCSEPEKAQILKSNKRLLDMVRYVHRETTNRYKTKVRMSETARLKKQRESVGYMAVSSFHEDQSMHFEHSHLLDVTTGECSFIRGHKRSEKSSSTPKVKKGKKDEAQDPAPTTSGSQTIAAKKVVRSLYGSAPPPKVKQSLVPQRPMNIGVRIPRSRRSTKPQSPKFGIVKTRGMKAASDKSKSGDAARKREVPSTASCDSDRKRTASTVIQINYEKTEAELNPLVCIEKLLQRLE